MSRGVLQDETNSSSSDSSTSSNASSDNQAPLFSPLTSNISSSEDESGTNGNCPSGKRSLAGMVLSSAAASTTELKSVGEVNQSAGRVLYFLVSLCICCVYYKVIC